MVSRVIAVVFGLALLAGCDLYNQELPDKTDAGPDMLVEDDAGADDAGADAGLPDGATPDGALD